MTRLAENLKINSMENSHISQLCLLLERNSQPWNLTTIHGMEILGGKKKKKSKEIET